MLQLDRYDLVARRSASVRPPRRVRRLPDENDLTQGRQPPQKVQGVLAAAWRVEAVRDVAGLVSRAARTVTHRHKRSS